MLDSVRILAEFWKREDVTDALRDRDMGALFTLLRRYTGASGMRLSIATGMTPTRFRSIVKHGSKVEALSTFERIAAGLDMPDDARITLGIAPRHDRR